MDIQYKNPALSAEERTENLLAQMTLEEKIGQMTQVAFSTVPKDEAEMWAGTKFAGSFLHVLGDDARHLQDLAMQTRLQIPLIFGIDAIHGHGLHKGATIFPTQLAAACSFNADLVEQMGRATAKEVAADGLHWTFSPVLCNGRDLRWGRINETFGEDPYLIGVMASAIIRGYQGKSLKDDDTILACAKHYIAYGESVGGRDAYDTAISLRKVKETFLPPFAKAVEAGCATFMTGYLPVDGVPITASKVTVRGLLKDELGFNGFVVTDWNNVGNLCGMQQVARNIEEAATMAVAAGNDMMMTTNEFWAAAIACVQAGTIPISWIDDAVCRILYIKFSMGLFEKVLKKTIPDPSIFSCPEHLALNLKLARESVVLLENKGVLPLRKTTKLISVVGPNADDIFAQYGDWTYFTHPDPNFATEPAMPYKTMLTGIKELAEAHNVAVTHYQGCTVMDTVDLTNFPPFIQEVLATRSDYMTGDNDALIEEAVCGAADADIIVAVMGDCIFQNGEFKDRGNLDLPVVQQRLLEGLKATGKPLVVILVNGKPLTVPWIKENVDALLETFNSGMFGGQAAAEVLFGDVNPSGRLPISFAHHVGQLPVYYNQMPGWHGGKYMDLPLEPLYTFGYGLGYSLFFYGEPMLSHKTCTKEDTVTVSVDVTNTGKMDGFEVVQAYIRDDVASRVTPVLQFKGFQKVWIKAGETRKIDIALPVKEWTLVDEDLKYVVEPGLFKIFVGPDARMSSLQMTEVVCE